jgi:DNA repair protein RadC
MRIQHEISALCEPATRRGYLFSLISLVGARQLGDIDLVAATLSGNLARRRRLAERLLDEVGSLWSVARLGLRPLRELGLGQAESARLKACIELGRRAAFEPPPGTAVREPRDAYRCVAEHLTDRERERFVVVVLDVKNRPRHIATVFVGSVDACPVDPREVFTPALRERGSAVLVAHNHPSGDPTPSPEDVILTERLVDAGAILGIPVLDHLVVGREADGNPRFVSMAQRGLLPRAEQEAA